MDQLLEAPGPLFTFLESGRFWRSITERTLVVGEGPNTVGEVYAANHNTNWTRSDDNTFNLCLDPPLFHGLLALEAIQPATNEPFETINEIYPTLKNPTLDPPVTPDAKCYVLPYAENQTYCIKLPTGPEPACAVTAALTGCSILVWAGANGTAYFAHSNVRTLPPRAYYQYDLVAAKQRAMRGVLDTTMSQMAVLEVNNGMIGPPGNVVEGWHPSTVEYGYWSDISADRPFRSFSYAQDSADTLESLVPSLCERGWPLPENAGYLNSTQEFLVLPQSLPNDVRLMKHGSLAAVFGVRIGGQWRFYYQEYLFIPLERWRENWRRFGSRNRSPIRNQQNEIRTVYPPSILNVGQFWPKDQLSRHRLTLDRTNQTSAFAEVNTLNNNN